MGLVSAQFLAGWLLVAGAILGVGWELGLMISGGGVGDRPLAEWLRIAGRMRWTVSIWIAQSLLVFAGFVVLAPVLLDSGDFGLGALAAASIGVSVCC